jgi:drug/metabolite transporter (DMT)-like permease
VTLAVFLAALASAMLHAAWSAATRLRADPGNALASVVVMAGVTAIPVGLYAGLPPPSAIKWLIGGAIFNLLTMRTLMATYRRTPFAVGYPIVRGMAPLSVTLISFVLLGDRMSPIALVGVGLISAGVLMLAESARRGEKFDRTGLALALASGFFNACFIITDVQGVRTSGDPLPYGFAVCIVNSLTMLGMLAVEGRRVTGLMMKGNMFFGLLASTLSTGSYLLVLYGFAHGPTGAVSALRETSVFFGLLLAAFMLRERVGPMRWIAAALAMLGAVAIRLS